MKKIGLVGMSNGQQRENKPNVLKLIKTINECGYEVALGDYIYETENYFSGSPQDKAKDLMKMYDDDDISQIFDISGGDARKPQLTALPLISSFLMALRDLSEKIYPPVRGSVSAISGRMLEFSSSKPVNLRDSSTDQSRPHIALSS
ncbi:MAG: LD-carboxypeptidase [Lachnospiraceae bacterium]|nr:LD-carboxypeptidase [Lachnospiraceae bacterium]